DPRSSTEPVPTTQGMREPLGFERLRICELFAELLHCSNMPRLNHYPPTATTTAAAASSEDDESVSRRDSPTTAPISLDGGDTMTAASAAAVVEAAEYTFADGTASVYSDVALVVSEPSDHNSDNTPVGQLLKWNLIAHKVLPTCVDLFFQFSLNNFLHSVVYDIMHQVLNLPLSLECNVALIVVAFRDVRITSRIAQACAANDEVCRLPRGIRLGYMGHLTGIGEEVARLLELSGAALEPLIAPFIDGDEWLDYVARTLQEVRDRDQQPLGGERPGGGIGSGGNDDGDSSMTGLIGDIDISGGAMDGGNQVFVSRMGLVDPSSNESYGPEDDDDDDDEEYEDDDEDDDEEDELDDHSEYSSHNRRSSNRNGRGYHHRTTSLSSSSASKSMYPNEEDDDESGIDYVNAHHSYFKPSVTHDDEQDQFIIKDDDDDDDDDVGLVDDSVVDDNDIGPADRIGRYRSHQNERALLSSEPADIVTAPVPATIMTTTMAKSDGEDDDDDEEDDDDGASEMGRMNDFLRNRAADLAEAARNGGGGGDEEEEEEESTTECHSRRRQVIRLSFDGSAHTVGTSGYHDGDTSLPPYLLSLSSSLVAPLSPSTSSVEPPETPPRPTPQQTMAFVPPPLLPSYLPPAISKLKAKQQLAYSSSNGGGGGGGEPKGRLQDLLYRESKQRSLSSSELDNIVPADIGRCPAGNRASSSSSKSSTAVTSASAPPSATDSDDDCGGGGGRRGRSGSFAVRRQRSRSQSAGVGISREMVIQAASQGQFPYLDAKTCEFVGQLKTDTVKMGGAAANNGSSNNSSLSRQRSNTAAAMRSQTGGQPTPMSSSLSSSSGSAPPSSTSSPIVNPAIHSSSNQQASGMRSSSLPQSSLRFLPMEEASSSDSSNSNSGGGDGLDLSGI
ncbi:sporulation-induced protein, partial [Coemansia sp. RSA 2052]